MTYKIINRKLKKIISGIEVHNRIIRKKLSHHYNDVYDKNLWSVGLYYSLIGHFKNIINILDSPRNLSGLFSLFRSCIDIYINLRNLDIKYDRYCQYEKEKLLQLSALAKSIDYDSLTNNQRKCIDKSWAHHHNMLKSLHEVDNRFLREKDKRKNIELPEIYEAFYQICCDHTHVSHTSIMQYHINKKNNSYFAVQTPIPPTENVLWSILVLLGIIYDSIVLINFNVLKNFDNHNLKMILDAVNSCNTSTLKKLKKSAFPFIE